MNRCIFMFYQNLYYHFFTPSRRKERWVLQIPESCKTFYFAPDIEKAKGLYTEKYNVEERQKQVYTDNSSKPYSNKNSLKTVPYQNNIQKIECTYPHLEKSKITPLQKNYCILYNSQVASLNSGMVYKKKDVYITTQEITLDNKQMIAPSEQKSQNTPEPKHEIKPGCEVPPKYRENKKENLSNSSTPGVEDAPTKEQILLLEKDKEVISQLIELQNIESHVEDILQIGDSPSMEYNLDTHSVGETQGLMLSDSEDNESQTASTSQIGYQSPSIQEEKESAYNIMESGDATTEDNESQTADTSQMEVSSLMEYDLDTHSVGEISSILLGLEDSKSLTEDISQIGNPSPSIQEEEPSYDILALVTPAMAKITFDKTMPTEEILLSEAFITNSEYQKITYSQELQSAENIISTQKKNYLILMFLIRRKFIKYIIKTQLIIRK